MPNCESMKQYKVTILVGSIALLSGCASLSETNDLEAQVADLRTQNQKLLVDSARASDLNQIIITHARSTECVDADLDSEGWAIGLRRKFGPGCVNR